MEILKMVCGNIAMKKVNAQTVIKIGVGNYVNVSTIMKHIKDHSKFVGKKTQYNKQKYKYKKWRYYEIFTYL